MKSRFAFTFCVIIFAAGLAARAEYRVFTLKIEKPGAEARFVESTLDPDQYRGYFPVAPDEVVTYVNTWRCRGRTDGKPLCPDPRAQGPETAVPPAAP